MYKPEQVSVEGGAAVITMEQLPTSKPAKAPTQQPDGEVWEVPKRFQSGMLQSWNKFWRVLMLLGGEDFGMWGSVSVRASSLWLGSLHTSPAALPLPAPLAPSPLQLHGRLRGGRGAAARQRRVERVLGEAGRQGAAHARGRRTHTWRQRAGLAAAGPLTVPPCCLPLLPPHLLQPAFWMMGNLGRAGYMHSTAGAALAWHLWVDCHAVLRSLHEAAAPSPRAPSLPAGMWPYSYDSCEGSEKQPWSGLDPQLITACQDRPSPPERAAWGLNPGQGRGAPEFDVFEIA